MDLFTRGGPVVREDVAGYGEGSAPPAAPEPTERYDTGTMCRLFGQLSDAHRTASVPLCSAENALRTQSHLHPHGWGIAWYGASGPRVRRGVMAAHADLDFVRAGRSARSRIVLAHVRDASVGRIALENTHPFVEGPWVFAHNGTVARYKRSRPVREALLAAISPARRRALRGETDSERCFQIFLSRLDLRAGRGRATVAEVRTALAETVSLVRAVADRGELRSTLNFLVSDGRLLCACRHGKPLHVSTGAGGGRIFAMASEPIGRSGWEAVPEGGFVGVDAALRTTRAPLGINDLRDSAGRAPGPARRGVPRSRR
jgi:predicted glutamine amidotransferase